MPDIIDIDEIARRYEAEAASVVRPKNPQKPYLKDYNKGIDYGKALDEYAFLVEKYKVSLSEYRTAIHEIENRHKEMVFKYLGIENHPAREKAWSIAYEALHPEGFRAVAQKLEELTEIM